MFIRVLKSNQPIVIFIIAILIGLLWLSSFIDPIAMKIPADSLNMPFYDLCSHYIPVNSFISVMMAFVLVIVQSIVLIQFNKRNIVINYRTYLPAFFYRLTIHQFTNTDIQDYCRDIPVLRGIIKILMQLLLSL